MNNKMIDELNSCNELSDLMVLLKKKIETSITTSTLAFFDKVMQPYDNTKGYQIINTKPFPLSEGESTYNLLVYVFNGYTFEQNEKLLVIFTDKNFINNLAFNFPKVTKSINLHSTQYAIGLKLKPEITTNITKSIPNNKIVVNFTKGEGTVQLDLNTPYGIILSINGIDRVGNVYLNGESLWVLVKLNTYTVSFNITDINNIIFKVCDNDGYINQNTSIDGTLILYKL